VVSGEFDVARQQNQVKDFIVRKVAAIVRHLQGEALPAEMRISTALYRQADADQDPRVKWADPVVAAPGKPGTHPHQRESRPDFALNCPRRSGSLAARR